MVSAIALLAMNLSAGDNIAEIEAALAREAQAGPRLKAASPKLLSATGGSDTYEATGELNVTKSSGSIVLKFNVPKAYTHVNSITLSMDAYDVDYPVSNERDMVYFNGVQLGRLQGGNNIWNENTFRFAPNTAPPLNVGENTLRIDVNVDNGGWITRIGWAKLVVDGEVDYINLEASQNYDDSIKLSWKDVSSGLVGARYYVDRRADPSGQFECLNEDNPTLDRHYYDNDRDCLPGVKYYYRVRSESGIESNEVVGKRVAKTVATVEPKFQFTLTGTDRPLEIGELGLKGEYDVLVAGHAFTCSISAENLPQNVTLEIGKGKLTGIPMSESPARNSHIVEWDPDLNYISPTRNERGNVVGRMNYINNSRVDIKAVFRSGPGYHGTYYWWLEFSYVLKANGNYIKVGTAYLTGERNVYFIKEGDDNGEHVKRVKKIRKKKLFGGYTEERKVVKEPFETMPNWYVYWRDDGACPGLKAAGVMYGIINGSALGEAIGGTDYVHIYLGAAYRYIRGRIDVDFWSNEEKLFGLRREGEKWCYAYGIHVVESCVAHELQHHRTYSHYCDMISKGFKDGDCDSKTCAIESGGYATCEDVPEGERKITRCDYIVDDDEDDTWLNRGYFYTLFNKRLYLEKGEVDTYKLREKSWTYGAYGDNELVARISGENYKAYPQRDFAYPGELAGGLPEDAILKNGPLPYSTKSAPDRQIGALNAQATASEQQSDTNLIITINGIAANTQRDQNSVTGIVYTIGVSIRGDDLVDFNGYLVDAQSNIVATAVSAANAVSESVELFFDSRNIFDNYNGGPLTLGRVDLTVDDNYSTNNVIGTLYDFAVEPIEVSKSELLCNKGYILDGATTNDVSASGIAVSIPVLVNVADDYRLEAELVSTNDELVATAFATNYCATGTNVFALTFSSDAIYQNGRSGIHAVKNVQLWCGDEMIDANAVALELTERRDIADFVPSGVSVAVDSSSGRFLEPAVTPDGKLSSVQFVFDVTNVTDTMVGYDVVSVLMNTNSEIVASIRTTVAVTNGLNQIEITIPASTIAKSGVNGPYRFESIELLPQGESSCGTTYRPSVLSTAYTASDFGASAIEACGTPRLVETPDLDRFTLEYSYNVIRIGRTIAEAVLVDRVGDFAARVVQTNELSETGVKTNAMSIASDDVVGGVTNGPYAVACLSLTPDIVGESPIYMDTESLTNIFWQVASPVLSPATKTVFFGQCQPVVMSCATSAAEIRYTLDGSEPAVDSALYDGSLVVSNSMTVKAKAFVDGMRPSETVQVEYIRAAIVGDNLVQNTSPEQGEPQTLRIPAPGTYRVSFDYTQGSDVELCMVQGGVTNTLAVVSATTAGSTNFLFDVSVAGDYELTICDLSSGVSQPADVSNLNISIPNTPENRKRYWIYETENTFGSTGEWIAEYGFQDGKMRVEDNSTFTPYTRSDGRFVTIVSTIEFDSISVDLVDYVFYVDAKAVIGIGTIDGNHYAFTVLTMEDGKQTWKTVGAEGLAEPAPHTPYTVKLTFDCTNKTYSAAIIGEGNVEFALTHGTTNEFAFAGQLDTAVEQVEFDGTWNVMSLSGNYRNVAAEFMCGDVLPLAGGQSSQALTDGQAAWLNSMKGYDAVKAKVATMWLKDFNDAYLLNLDISQSEFGLGMFKVTGIDVTENEVRVTVVLNRTGAVQVANGNEHKDAPINGFLKLFGGETPTERTLLNATIMTDANFGSSDTEVFVYPRSGSAKFFRPAIVSP